MSKIIELSESIIEKYVEAKANMIEYKLKYQSYKSKFEALEMHLASLKAENILLNTKLESYESRS
jgi:hypothetical protein